MRTSSGAFTAMTKTTTRVVCDAGPLIHLYELGSLYLLADFETVLLPDGAYKEVLKHRPEAIMSSSQTYLKFASTLTQH